MKRLGKQRNLTQQQVMAQVEYDPMTGIVTYKRSTLRIKPGMLATRTDAAGYVTVQLAEAQVRAHQIAYMCMTGEWPASDIDHINGEKADNRWRNLRDVPHAVNNQNSHKPQSNNRLQVRGVGRHGKNGYRAAIQAFGKRVNLGTFPTLDGARQAYLDARQVLHAEALCSESVTQTP
jgi:hypothetical protein